VGDQHGVFRARYGDYALRAYPDLGWRDYPIIPQGRCIVPDPRELQFSPFSTDIEASRVEKLLRPAFPGEDDFVILGTGQVEVRKGVDIFIDGATKAVALAPDLKCRFFWIGREFDALSDVSYSVYIADQICRSGLEGRVFFLGERGVELARQEQGDAQTIAEHASISLAYPPEPLPITAPSCTGSSGFSAWLPNEAATRSQTRTVPISRSELGMRRRQGRNG